MSVRAKVKAAREKSIDDGIGKLREKRPFPEKVEQLSKTIDFTYCTISFLTFALKRFLINLFIHVRYQVLIYYVPVILF